MLEFFASGKGMLKKFLYRIIGAISLLNPFLSLAQSQQDFPYAVSLKPRTLSGLVGLHSFAHGHWGEYRLLVAGRLDGLHARQPFNSFPNSQNNTNLYVFSTQSGSVWSAPLSSLSVAQQEQLQSTNSNFIQVGEKLYIIGGYGAVGTATKQTYRMLTVINVPEVINGIRLGTPFNNAVRSMVDDRFAVTGGAMGRFGDTLILVGGHRFDGSYNPNNGPSFTQSYTNQIRKFKVDLNSPTLSLSYYEAITDNLHFHRRDYNLVPQVYPDGRLGYMISTGVFQVAANLPYLYPVHIQPQHHWPQENFSQYLSHYHSPKVALYDSVANKCHSLFFGGMAQYYYQNGTLQQDDNVPFVNTISGLTRNADSSMVEFVLPSTMPGLKGSSAEFLPNYEIPKYENGVVKLNASTGDSILLGYIFGGISSTTLNPFTNNRTASDTRADATLYEIYLKRVQTSVAKPVQVKPSFSAHLANNPIAKGSATISVKLSALNPALIQANLYDAQGKQLASETLPSLNEQEQSLELFSQLHQQLSTGIYFLVLHQGKTHSVTLKVVVGK